MNPPDLPNTQSESKKLHNACGQGCLVPRKFSAVLEETVRKAQFEPLSDAPASVDNVVKDLVMICILLENFLQFALGMS